MRKSIYGIFWILSLVMVFLANNSISLAQPSVETTNTQDGQNSVNVEQANDLQNQIANETTGEIGNSGRKKSSLDNFIQSYYRRKYRLLTETKQHRVAGVSERLSAFFSTPTAASKSIEDINDQRKVLETSELRYLSFTIKTTVEYNTLKDDNNTISFRARIYYAFNTNAKDAETGEPIVPEGYDAFNISVTQQENKWVIIKEEKTYEEFSGDDISLVDQAIQPENERINPSYTKSYAYTYTPNTAAAFANDHWNNVTNISNYTDYTNSGGDCTNFLSRCLREGGWAQTNNWFFISDGESGNNMSLYKRSPSWAGAKFLYQYISNTGMYAGVNGNNRVNVKFTNLVIPSSSASATTWTNFYNKLKVLKKGDIAELASTPGTVHHHMIVTSYSTTKPYVYFTFRNGDPYLPHQDWPITNFTPGEYVNGFNIKTSGY